MKMVVSDFDETKNVWIFLELFGAREEQPKFRFRDSSVRPSLRVNKVWRTITSNSLAQLKVVPELQRCEAHTKWMLHQP
jgi:hypothetical protein